MNLWVLLCSLYACCNPRSWTWRQTAWVRWNTQPFTDASLNLLRTAVHSAASKSIKKLSKASLRDRWRTSGRKISDLCILLTDNEPGPFIIQDTSASRTDAFRQGPEVQSVHINRIPRASSTSSQNPTQSIWVERPQSPHCIALRSHSDEQTTQWKRIRLRVHAVIRQQLDDSDCCPLLI